jgi:hypothetical protein
LPIFNLPPIDYAIGTILSHSFPLAKLWFLWCLCPTSDKTAGIRKISSERPYNRRLFLAGYRRPGYCCIGKRNGTAVISHLLCYSDDWCCWHSYPAGDCLCYCLNIALVF